MFSANSALLKVEGLEKRFGGITALTDYNVKIRRGELVGLIGPNGAGKTTVFNLLSGVLNPTGGRIYFNNKDITRLRPDQNTALGIARTFQNIRLFKELSVLDNIKVAFHMRLGRGFWETLFHTSTYRRAEIKMQQRSHEIMELFGLTSVRDIPAKNLPIVSGDGFDTELVTSVPGDKLANDVYFSTHTYREDNRPEVVAFVAAYEKEYGRPPENAFAALGFDAVGLIADAIKRAGTTDGKALRAALAGTQGFKAVTGEITYSRTSGVPMKGVSIISVHDGKYKVEEVWFPNQ